MKYIATVLLWFAFVTTGLAQSSVEQQIDDFVKAEMERQKIPGVSLAVVRDGRAVLVKGYGFANLEHKVAVKPETIFQSGSVGKQFTAAAVMLLVQDGKINLDDKIGKYLGDVPESWGPITIRHLLTHTSGLTDYPEDFDFRRDYTEAELIKIAGKIPLAFAPGERWEYSNIGYMTLGVLIGKVTGKFYGDFLRERIFITAGMLSARIISESDIVPNRAAGYRVVDDEIKNQNWVSPSMNTTADGSLYLSVLDLVKWDEALSKRSLLNSASYDAIWTPAVLNSGARTSYGFGWALKSTNGHRLIEHGGAWQGFRSFISRYVDDKLTVIALANSSNANPQRLAHRVAEMIEPNLRPVAVAGADARLAAEMKELFQSVLDGKADLNRFAPDLQKRISDRGDRLRQFLTKIGPILSFDLVRAETIDGDLTATFEVQFGSMTVALGIAKGKDGKISRFEVHPE
jgi:CubicO group peptidase (beta-lactamase class C family)